MILASIVTTLITWTGIVAVAGCATGAIAIWQGTKTQRHADAAVHGNDDELKTALSEASLAQQKTVEELAQLNIRMAELERLLKEVG